MMLNKLSNRIVTFFSSRLLARFNNRGKLLRLYPPFLFMGVKVLQSTTNPPQLVVKLPLSWRTANPGGSMFGGFQAAFADPIAPVLCLMVLENVHVMTKELNIKYLRRADEALLIEFSLDNQQLASIKKQLAMHGKANPMFSLNLIKASNRELCSSCQIVVSIKNSKAK